MQINRAMRQLSQVIQQNASASEELSSTSEELASKAEELKSAIDFFRVEDGPSGRAVFRPEKNARQMRSGHIAKPARKNTAVAQRPVVCAVRPAGVAIKKDSGQAGMTTFYATLGLS